VKKTIGYGFSVGHSMDMPNLLTGNSSKQFYNLKKMILEDGRFEFKEEFVGIKLK